MKARIVLILIGVAVLGATIYQVAQVSGHAAPFVSRENLSAVSAAAPALTVPAAAVRAEGRLVTYPGEQVTVGTEIPGTIISLRVKEKEFVRKGEVIVVLRAGDLQASLASAEARVKESDADIALYQTEVERQKKLWQQEVASRQALDRAQRDLDSSIARRDTNREDARRLQAVLDKTVIVAPISGVVTSRMVQPGETVKEGSALLTIANLNRTRVEAEVDEFDAGRIKLGQEAEITAEGYDSQRWRGKVEEIPDTVERRQIKPQDPAAPTDTRVLLVKIALLEKTPLKLGQRVQVGLMRLPELKIER